jgi:hypothetical protein
MTQTLREGCEYRYPTLEERNKNKNLGEKPLDKDNHLMDCLRYICQELPYNYLDIKRLSYANYMRFFEAQSTNKPKALSFKEALDIINRESTNEKFANKQEYAGGYFV